MGGEIRVAILPHCDGRHLVGLERLATELVVVDHGVRSDNHFGHRHRQIAALADAHVLLHHRQLARFLGDDQDTRKEGHRLAPRATIRAPIRAHRLGDRKQIERALENHAARHLDEDAVTQESGVERDEGVIVEAGEATEMLVHLFRVGFERLGQAADDDALRQPLEVG